MSIKDLHKILTEELQTQREKQFNALLQHAGQNEVRDAQLCGQIEEIDALLKKLPAIAESTQSLTEYRDQAAAYLKPFRAGYVSELLNLRGNNANHGAFLRGQIQAIDGITVGNGETPGWIDAAIAFVTNPQAEGPTPSEENTYDT